LKARGIFCPAKVNFIFNLIQIHFIRICFSFAGLTASEIDEAFKLAEEQEFDF
jgi:hypothetical protein